MAAKREVEIPFFSKAPFANYDLVVYLGGGLFTVLILWRYIGKPLGIFDFSDVMAKGAHSWVTDVIYLILLGVCSYVLGHLISYQSSFFIEGFLQRTLGKFSEVVEATTVPPQERAGKLRAAIRQNIKANFRFTFRVPRVGIRLPKVPLLFVVHLPVLPWYSAVTVFGMFNFVDTRLPARMLDKMKERMQQDFAEFGYQPSGQWFRWIEYYTAYNRSVSSSSMYNYLVIFGLMRSLSYIFLICIWLEIANLIVSPYLPKYQLSHGPGGLIGTGLYFVVIYVAYITTITSYCKFFRRYIEEAAMGYLLEGTSGSNAA